MADSARHYQLVTNTRPPLPPTCLSQASSDRIHYHIGEEPHDEEPNDVSQIGRIVEDSPKALATCAGPPRKPRVVIFRCHKQVDLFACGMLLHSAHNRSSFLHANLQMTGIVV